MGRRKLSVATLQNKKARLAMFERRKKNLLKKASELSTLCDIDTCVIIFPPPDSENLKVATFPEDPTNVIKRYKGYDAKKQKKKNYDLRELFNDRKNQVKSEASNLMCPTWDDSFGNVGEDQLRMYVSALDCKILECNQKIDLLMKEKELDMSVVSMACSMQNDNCLEISPFSLVSSSHDVLEETHQDFMSTLDSEFQEGNDQMVDMYNMEYFDDLIRGTPLVTLPDSPVVPLTFMQNDSCLEIPASVISPHDVSDETHMDLISTLDDQMIGMFKMESLDGLIMGTPLFTLPGISNQNHLSFLQNTPRIDLLMKEKESYVPVVPMSSMQNDNCLEIPFSLVSSSHDVSEETHLDFLSTLDSEFQVGNDQMVDMFKMDYLDDLIMGTPLVTPQDISNQNHFSFLQNTLFEDNRWSNEPLADGSSHGMIESHCLQDKVFQYGLEILI